MAYVCPRRLPFLAHQTLLRVILTTTDDRSFWSAGIRLGHRRQTDARKRWARLERATDTVVTLTLPFSKRTNRGFCAPRLNMAFGSVYWTCAPLTSRETPGDVARSSTLSSPILPVRSCTPRISEKHKYQPEFDSSFLDGVRAGAKRLGRKKERAAHPSHPAQPRQYVFGPAIRCSSVTSQAF